MLQFIKNHSKRCNYVYKEGLFAVKIIVCCYPYYLESFFLPLRKGCQGRCFVT